MQVDRQQVVELIRTAIDELNENLAPEQQVDPSPDTVLLGEHSALDSLEFVTLIFDIERRIDETFGVPVTVGNQVTEDSDQSPIRTIGYLIDYVTQQLAESSPEKS